MKKQSVSKKLRSINTFAEGDIVQGFYLCVEKNLRYTKTKDLYIDIELRDISGRINAKIWDNVDKHKEKFNSGDAIAASGVVDEKSRKSSSSWIASKEVFIAVIFVFSSA